MAEKTGSTSPTTRHRYPLSAQTRQRLRQKRYDLSLSFERLGKLLSVHWSTVRKWETGETSHYSAAHHEALQAFLAGDYDHRFFPGRDIAPLPLPGQDYEAVPITDCRHLNCALRRISHLYQLAEKIPKLRLAILQQMEELSDGILARLAMEKDSGSSPPPAP
jgi:hypothetical protein